jgi:transcriptional regulator with PAS, ATPase and Fis domain
LFGHEKGAFTGALERRAGCFELAQHGTLLLDELAEMPTGTQAKLLRVLEDSRVRRLGGKTEISVDVRVIAATNRIIDEALKKGDLREDLYYRLNVFQIALPPLRSRLDDLAILCDALILNLNRKHACNINSVSGEVMDAFRRYAWPGNVRELRNAVERAAVLGTGGPLEPRDFALANGSANGHASGNGHLGGANGNSGHATETSGTVPHATGGASLDLKSQVEAVERQAILRALEASGGNRRQAASLLGISLRTLFYKMRRLPVH